MKEFAIMKLALVQGVRPFSVNNNGQNIRTCMCSFTFNPAFHQNSKIFSYNLLALPLIYCWPTVDQLLANC